MSRNDLCFCGSGIKQKKCHSDILAYSIEAELIKVHKSIDKKVATAEGKANNCKKGCSECCKQYFLISPIEFYHIISQIELRDGISEVYKFLEKGNKQFYLLEKENPKLAQTLTHGISTKNINDTNEINNSLQVLSDSVNSSDDYLSFACPFLSESDGSCLIYEYRPIICRCHGIGYLERSEIGIPCRESSLDNFNPQYFVDLTEFYDESMKYIMLSSKKYQTSCMDRVLPIFYFCKFLYETDRSFILNKINKVRHLSREEYVNDKIGVMLNK